MCNVSFARQKQCSPLKICTFRTLDLLTLRNFVKFSTPENVHRRDRENLDVEQGETQSLAASSTVVNCVTVPIPAKHRQIRQIVLCRPGGQPLSSDNEPNKDGPHDPRQQVPSTRISRAKRDVPDDFHAPRGANARSRIRRATEDSYHVKR